MLQGTANNLRSQNPMPKKSRIGTDASHDYFAFKVNVRSCGANLDPWLPLRVALLFEKDESASTPASIHRVGLPEGYSDYTSYFIGAGMEALSSSPLRWSTFRKYNASSSESWE